jgi:formyl-CoA transferase
VPETDQTKPKLPLAGMRVIDLSCFLAAPIASMFMADFGADVVKVERPDTGDEMRYWGNDKEGVGLYYKVINRNKRSVTADLRTPFGVEVVKRLVKDADVVCENFRPGTLERWGIGWDVLSAINPGLVMLRITGFGQTGPNRSRPGFGTLAEAYSGFAFTNGYPDRPPILPSFGLADSTAGLMGAYLTMVALQGRANNGGRGQYIDLALYEPLFTLMGPHAVNFDQLGIVQERTGSLHNFTSPRNCYRTRDGRYVAIAGAAQTTFERMCEALEIPEVPKDPRFLNNRLRLMNVHALDAVMAEAIGRFDYDDMLERFLKAEATVAPVNDISQIFADPHYQARENIATIEDAELGGPVRFQNVVGKLSDTPGRIAHAGPRLGIHNREVLVDELGFGEDEVRAAGLKL